MEFINAIRFDDRGLVPAVVQDYKTKAVLMLAYMSEESINMTIETGKATYFSRSKGRLWVKGEESGHFQYVKGIYLDCDGDAIKLEVEQVDVACHTNNYSCFYRKQEGGGLVEVDTTPNSGADIIYDVYDVICDRIVNPKEGSYTNYLFDKGLDKMLKKVGEEASEVIIGAKNRSKDEVQYEAADLIFHLLVVLKEIGLEPDDIFAELAKRR